MIFSAPAFAQQDRKADVIGIGFYDLAEPVRFEKLTLVFGKMQGNRRAAGRTFGGGDRKAALSIRRPLPARVLAGAAGEHVNPVGDHERRIETDPELTDQCDVLLRIAGQLA